MDCTAQHFKDLIAWQKAMDLVTETYKLTDNFPKREIFSLTDQIRRAAVSILSNIAEGQAHTTIANFAISSAIPQVRWPNSRRSYFSPSASSTPILGPRRVCLSKSMKSEKS